jgi:hypothetical protein
MGGHGVSADIIPLTLRRDRKRGVIDFSASASPPDDLVMDHIDTSPCEYVRPDEPDPAFIENINA